MNLRCRPAAVSDLETCAAFSRDHFACSERQKTALTALWVRLLKNGSAAAAIIEDLDLPPGRRIVWFSLNLFIADWFSEHLKTTAGPFAALQVLDKIGRIPSPVLGLPALRTANTSRGLNLLVASSGSPESALESESGRFLRDRITEFFYYIASGYCLREILIEEYGERERDWAAACGFHLRTDYAGRADDLARPLSNGKRAFLMGCTADEARPGTVIGSSFTYAPPRFYFEPREQEVLLQALSGDTDDEIAARLGVAAVTVKKRWGAIYLRVARVAPDLLPARAGTDRKRGMEKKRRLLSYLRYHMGELRPLNIPAHLITLAVSVLGCFLGLQPGFAAEGG